MTNYIKLFVAHILSGLETKNNVQISKKALKLFEDKPLTSQTFSILIEKEDHLDKGESVEFAHKDKVIRLCTS